VKAAEEDHRRRIAYDEALAVRDELAAELADLYLGFVEKLSGMLSRIVASDRKIEYINGHGLPRPVGHVPRNTQFCAGK
jgi:hypothetical protein